MPPIDLTRDVKDAKDSKDVSKLFADLEVLHSDKSAFKSTVDATNEANKDLIKRRILPKLDITNDGDGEKVTVGNLSVKFMDDGSKIEYSDDRFPQNATKIIRQDGSQTEVKWKSETIVEAILNKDKNGKETTVEAKNGVTIECDNTTGKVITTNADGTKTVQCTDGVVEHQDKDGKVVSRTDSAGNPLPVNNSMQNKIDSAAGRINSALAQIGGDPSKARDGIDQLYAILAELDPLIACADPTVAAHANSAHVLVTSAMCGAESRSKPKPIS